MISVYYPRLICPARYEGMKQNYRVGAGRYFAPSVMLFGTLDLRP